VLDVACGSGRHLAWLGAEGHRVCGIDRDAAALEAARARLGEGTAELLHADLESAPWPLPGRRFDAVVVTNYLWRPLLPTLVASVAPRGLLLYETFAVGNETLGRPSNPDFLLRPGELLDAVRGRCGSSPTRTASWPRRRASCSASRRGASPRPRPGLRPGLPL
jgi:SAM-dependent methyltransferase